MAMTRRRFTLLIGALVGALLSVAPPARATDGDTAGTVARVKGTAVAVQDAIPRALKEGDAVLIGDILSTGKDSRVEIKMIDDGVFTLGERTSFVVMDYLFGQGQDNVALRLMSGTFKAVSGQIAQADASKFRVETDFGTIGIRGTDFWGGVMDDGAFHVALLAGKAVLFANRGGKVEITEAGFGTTITGPDAAPSTPRLWPDAKLSAAKVSVAFE